MRIYHSTYLPLGVGHIPANRIVCVAVWIELRYFIMRILSFILVIIGGCLAFSGEATGWGIALIIIGVLLNIIYHFFNYINEKNG